LESHVSDIARMLGRDEKTVRRHLRPLVGLGLLKLAGKAGEQYYLFNAEKYEAYLALDPNTLIEKTPLPTETASQGAGEGLAPRNGTGLLPK
jgi:hypothetical protein